MPRWILVDDTDLNIVYAGSWTANHGSQDNVGNFGVPLLSTLHGATSDASFSYSFKGSRVLITGTLQYSNSSGPVTNPSWECFVDGIGFPVQNYTVAENRLLFCEKDGLTDEVTHIITLKAHVSDQRIFWFDYIQYVPSPSVPLDQVLLSIDVPDPQMQFGPGWSSQNGYTTSTEGSTLKFDFIGVSVTWLGTYNKDFSFAATTGSYTIDGIDETTFPLNGALSTLTGVQFNQIFFQTQIFSAGQHTLEVTYNGNSQTTPLSLQVLFVQNGTCSTPSCSPPSTASSTPASSSTPSIASFTPLTASTVASPRSSTHHSANAGPIVGGVIGGFFAIVTCILLYTFYRRRLSRRSPSRVDPMIIKPFTDPVAPSMSSNSNLEGKSFTFKRPFFPFGQLAQCTLRKVSWDITMTSSIGATFSGSRVARDEESGVTRLPHANKRQVAVEMPPPEYSRD